MAFSAGTQPGLKSTRWARFVVGLAGVIGPAGLLVRRTRSAVGLVPVSSDVGLDLQADKVRKKRGRPPRI